MNGRQVMICGAFRSYLLIFDIEKVIIKLFVRD